ncbi:heterokaryon incompatibility protein-domain-containing protein [Xylaria sp. FL0043]|nr:heterokaryon incompatibility protein-domain-containing protein [Xylaria sp. FL0043]
MRLLNTNDYTFVEFMNPGDTPPYAILSHCWSHDPSNREVSHSDLISATYDTNGPGWQKIKRCCSLALSRGLQWAWIDTCCIDKTSSAELSEAINSMFAWYRDAKECYVFLDDVDLKEMPRFPGADDGLNWMRDLTLEQATAVHEFMGSRWFTRGWTLQELLAPKDVLFFSSRDVVIGTRRDLAPFITIATRIRPEFLNGNQGLQDASIAQRMCWASSRTTTRVEDTAYSLLGIFDVNMPLLYGEGEKAFLRLQQEIIRASDDDSIFAWEHETRPRTLSGVLAASPRDFTRCHAIVRDWRNDRRSGDPQPFVSAHRNRSRLKTQFQVPRLHSSFQLSTFCVKESLRAVACIGQAIAQQEYD